MVYMVFYFLLFSIFIQVNNSNSNVCSPIVCLTACAVRYSKTWPYLSNYDIYTHILVGECFHFQRDGSILIIGDILGLQNLYSLCGEIYIVLMVQRDEH